MTTFDLLFFNVFHHYKPTQKKKANTIALFYISALQCSLLLLSGVLIALFLNEMNTVALSSGKAWTLFIMASIFIYFKNWIQYSGKKRRVLNAKKNTKHQPQHYNIWVLWAFLIGSTALSIILLMA
ncbi:hypothetical protein [Psychroserpens algicola]|uniref:DUF3899 domain-containing protein n=1 Tax=Psychroserpens algicola TaxID=1719034 RepID=A0ABT0H8C1_9FLAO|nr:hypothetical protein [Psychroserpens algicola]MCK8480279.1 hypothetical protein [Psychroserpens algicola]